jgi:MFS family permease
MYLPSLPDIGRSLQASTLQVQLTISSYLFGSAVGQIFYGPLSDRFAVPAIRAGALTPFRDRAATAASVMGFTQQMGAAIAATVVGFYLGHSAWPVASVVAVMGCMSFLIWLATRRVRAAR